MQTIHPIHLYTLINTHCKAINTSLLQYFVKEVTKNKSFTQNAIQYKTPYFYVVEFKVAIFSYKLGQFLINRTSVVT